MLMGLPSLYVWTHARPYQGIMKLPIMSGCRDYGLIRSCITVTVSVLLQHVLDSGGICSGYAELLSSTVRPTALAHLFRYAWHCQRAPQDGVKMLSVGAIRGGVTLLGELLDLFPQPGNLLPLRVPVVQCPCDCIRPLHRSRDRVRVGGYEYPLPR